MNALPLVSLYCDMPVSTVKRYQRLDGHVDERRNGDRESADYGDTDSRNH